MENENEVVDSTTNEDEIVEDTPVETDDVDALKETVTKVTETNKKLYARAKKAEGFELKDGKWVKPPKEEKPVVAPTTKPEAKSGGLDETQLDYLDLKGITETEDVDIIESVIKKTGQTVRQVLKDEYVLSKLNANKTKRETAAATPSSTKRGGNQTTDIGAAIAKFDATGELPSDYATRTKVVNSITDRDSTNKPSWHK